MARDPKPGEWRYTVGEVPVQLTAHERADRGNAIYTRIWDGKRYLPGEKKKLCGSIRDARSKIVPDMEVAAQKLAIERQRAKVAGIDTATGGPLTLSEGFRRLLHKREGKFAGGSTWRKDIDRVSKVIVLALGGDTLSRDIRHMHYRKLWRYIVAEHVRANVAGKVRFGPRQAEIIVGALRSTMVWLQQEGHIEAGVGLPAPNWKQAMRSEWETETNRPLKSAKKPRYTVAENVKLWGAMPHADPRIATVAQIGAELRIGQVARSRRTDVHPHHGFRIGAVEVHGRGKKRGAMVVLSMQERHALTRAMLRGHLAELERAFRAGEIEDYYLITGGRLRTIDGVLRSPVERAGEAWGRTGLRKGWRKLEQIADVEHVDGRLWYGLRRLSADLAEDVESDARVLNAQGGWTHTATREGYQQQGRTDIAEKASVLRTKTRPNVKRRNNLQDEKGSAE